MAERFTEIFAEPGQSAMIAPSARFPSFIGLAVNPSVMATLVLCVFCVGSIGFRIALHMARLGVRTLRLVDRGRLKPESLLTHPVRPEDIGKPKASFLGRLCKNISPSTRVLAYDGPAEALALEDLLDVDLFVMAGDNLRVETHVGSLAMHLGRPLIQASVHGPSLVAQVRFLTNDGSGSCPACQYSRAEWAHLNSQTIFSCEGFRRGKESATDVTQPTMSTSFLCAIAADLAAAAILRWVLKLGAPLTDSLTEYAGYTNRMTISPLPRRTDCPLGHRVWRRLVPPRPLENCSLAELAQAAGAVNLDRVGFDVNGEKFVERAACACGQVHEPRRFLAGGQSAGRCIRCNARIEPLPFFTHRPVPARVLGPETDNPIGQLVNGSPEWVLVDLAEPDRPALFR
jgi:molybdopterin/thiamine biosynthesis adenylyltransferase